SVRSPAENLTRAPSALGWSPARSSSAPALASSSLYLPIASRSSSLGIWPGSGSPLIIMMNRGIVVPPSRSDLGPGRLAGWELRLYLRVERRYGESTGSNDLLSSVRARRSILVQDMRPFG